MIRERFDLVDGKMVPDLNGEWTRNADAERDVQAAKDAKIEERECRLEEIESAIEDMDSVVDDARRAMRRFRHGEERAPRQPVLSSPSKDRIAP